MRSPRPECLVEGVSEKTSIAETPIPGGWTNEQLSIAGYGFDLLRPSDPEAFLEQCEMAGGEDERPEPCGGLRP